MRNVELHVRPLDAAAFAAFGEVIRVPAEEGDGRSIGTGTYWPDAVPAPEGDLRIGLIRYDRRPLEIARMERHPESGQTFLPLGHQPFLLVVAPSRQGDGTEKRPDVAALAAFIGPGDVGVRLAPGTWHVSPFPLAETCTVAEIAAPGTIGQGTDWYELDERVRLVVTF